MPDIALQHPVISSAAPLPPVSSSIHLGPSPVLFPRSVPCDVLVSPLPSHQSTAGLEPAAAVQNFMVMEPTAASTPL